MKVRVTMTATVEFAQVFDIDSDNVDAFVDNVKHFERQVRKCNPIADLNNVKCEYKQVIFNGDDFPRVFNSSLGSYQHFSSFADWYADQQEQCGYPQEQHEYAQQHEEFCYWSQFID